MEGTTLDAITILFLIFVIFGAALFLGGIVWAGIVSLRNQPETMPQFLLQSTTIIGGVLATNLGSVLGLAVASEQGGGLITTSSLSATSIHNLQVGAAWLYAAGLFLAFGFWVANKFSTAPEKVVSTLPELSKTLLGVVVGALAVVLGVVTQV